MALTIATASDHYDLVARIRTAASAQSWTELLVDTTSANHLIIWQAPGFSGTEQIFMGIRTNQDVTADYYNIEVFSLIGYVPGNSYNTQPGYKSYGVPLWNHAIPFWLEVNPQRLVCVAIVQNVDMSFGVGKMFPYATPGQFPYPIVVFGMCPGPTIYRYSTTASDFTMGIRGWHIVPGYAWVGNISMRFIDGTQVIPEVYPYNLSLGGTPFVGGTPYAPFLRNTNTSDIVATGDYGIYPLILTDLVPANTVTIMGATGNLYGDLDGIFYIAGFNNATSNIITDTATSITYLVFRDGVKTSFNDYCALRLN